MTAWRQDLHAHPELGFEEHRTSGRDADVADRTARRPFSRIVIGMLSRGVISRHPSRRLSARDTILREPIRKVWSIFHTCMKFRYSPRRGYYTVDGYPLRDGLRAAIGEQG